MSRLAVSLLLIAGLTLTGCSATDDVVVLDTTVVSWPGPDGSTSGQVIVSVRNDASVPIDPDVLGRGRQTAAYFTMDRYAGALEDWHLAVANRFAAGPPSPAAEFELD